MRKRLEKFPIPLAANLCRQIVHILASVHRKGFIQRDVKPSNLLLGLGGKGTSCYLVHHTLEIGYSLGHLDMKQGTGTSIYEIFKNVVYKD